MTVLSELFGEGAQLKVLETFVENYNDKLYAADIIRMTDVSKVTVAKHIRKLLEEGIIEKKEKTGAVQFYQLNLNNPKAKIILLLEQYIVSERLKKMVAEEVEISVERDVKDHSAYSIKTSIQTDYGKSGFDGFNPILKSNYSIGPAVRDISAYSILERGITSYE
mgnify:FL=1